MDASAYLKKQGWRGLGHSLDHTDRGIKKPLLVSKKVDVLGVGLNKHAAVSDQWWLKAFDQSLKDLGSGKESALAQVQKHGMNRGGLYTRFVKGEGVPGTMGKSVASSAFTTPMNIDTTSAPMSKPGIIPATGAVLPDDQGSTSNRKRKRTEESDGKQSRRKVEHDGKDKTRTTKADLEREEAKKTRRKADQMVLFAHSRGLLPDYVAEAFKSRRSSVSQSAGYFGFDSDQAMADFFAGIPLDQKLGSKGSKAQKYARENAKRLLRRTAMAHLTGGAVDEKKKRKGKRTEREALQAQKDEKRREHQAAKLLKKSDKSAQKKRDRLDRQRVDTAVASSTLEPAAEGELGNTKSIPGARVGRYPTKAEKRATKFAVQCIANLTPEKLESYRKKASERGISLETYVKRRNEKALVKEAPEQKPPADETLSFVVDTTGNEELAEMKDSLESLDPTLTEKRRAEKKAGKSSSSVKSRSAKKLEVQEDFLYKLLKASRDALAKGQHDGDVVIDGLAAPIIQLEHPTGKFSKADTKTARSVSRRVLKKAKK